MLFNILFTKRLAMNRTVFIILLGLFSSPVFSQGISSSVSGSAYRIDTTLTYSTQLTTGYQVMFDKKKGDEFGGAAGVFVGYNLYRDLIKQAFRPSAFIGASLGINNEHDLFLFGSARYYLASNNYAANAQVQIYPWDKTLINWGMLVEVGIRQIGVGDPTGFASIGLIFTNRKKLKHE